MAFCGQDVEEALIQVTLTDGKVVRVRFNGHMERIREEHFAARVVVRPGVTLAIERYGDGPWQAMHSI